MTTKKVTFTWAFIFHNLSQIIMNNFTNSYDIERVELESDDYLQFTCDFNTEKLRLLVEDFFGFKFKKGVTDIDFENCRTDVEAANVIYGEIGRNPGKKSSFIEFLVMEFLVGE